MRLFHFIKSKFDAGLSAYEPPQEDPALSKKMGSDLMERVITIRQMFSDSGDLLIREVTISGVKCAVCMCEGMVNTNVFSKMFAQPLTNLTLEQATPQKLLEWVRSQSLLAPDQKEFYTYGEFFRFIMSGFVVILIEQLDMGIAMGIQGFAGRGVDEPATEVNVRGSREGFIEMLRPNMALLRRRIKSPHLIFELFPIGTKSKTDVMLVYMDDVVSPELLREIRYRLSKVKIDVVLETGYLQPFLDSKPVSLFSGVGTTERPDTLCAKIAEGRVGVMLDGTPFALVVPYLFTENFQSFDDYSHRPYFATFIRWLKYTAFLFSVLLPGLYVAIASFHPELFPSSLLFSLVISEENTPFPLMLEAFIIFFIFEMMREAGLRLPRPVGHAVGIVGALVIGDAAVTAGIIGAPMVMVVALTAISSFVVPSLYEPVTFLRFAFILIGGIFGIFGITLGLCAVFVNLCAINPLGVPATTPATPFSSYAMRDVLFRWGWRTLQKEDLRVQDLKGSNLHMRGGEKDEN